MTTFNKCYGGARILVADDQPSIIDLIRRTLGDNFGCEIETVSSGDQAIALLQESSFDIFLTDMKMPGLHGVPLIDQVVALCPDTHIVVMTGYPRDFPYMEMIEKGAKDFLSKPFMPAELLAKLTRVLDERILRHNMEVAHTKYRSLFDQSMDGQLLLTMEGLRVEDANEAMCTLLGVVRSELMAQDFVGLLAEKDQERFSQWMGVCARSGRGTIGDLQVMQSNDSGVHFDVTITVVDADGEKFAFLTFRDITEKREVERKLADAAQRDGLTGLYNKRSFSNRVEWAVSSAAESEARMALLLIDLDNFKRCNDTHGHQIGDELLKTVGDVIKASIRITVYDEGFRCGGDEFAVLLHNFIDGGPMVVAERMRSKFDEADTYGTSMSIGVAEFKTGMDTAELIRAADDALYKAKGQGKNAVCEA